MGHDKEIILTDTSKVAEDDLRETAEMECIALRTGNTVEPSETYRDLFQLRMGAMTVYRKRLRCRPHGTILPWKYQSWGAYMGTRGDSLFHKNV